MADKQIVDARGLSCPQPVLMTKKALEASPSAKCFEIIVDNGTAKENVTRFAQNAGFTVTIECETDGNALHIQITDNGKGIEDVPRALEPFYTTLSDEERSGMGFTIMQTFMNDFRVQSKKGTGTTVFMSKYFNRNDGTDELADAE